MQSTLELEEHRTYDTYLIFNISTLYSRKTASVEGSKWDVGNIMNDEPIHANSITPDPLSLAAPPIIEGGKLRGAGIYSTNLFD